MANSLKRLRHFLVAAFCATMLAACSSSGPSLPSADFVSPQEGFGLASSLWKKLPLPVANVLGPMVSGYLG